MNSIHAIYQVLVVDQSKIFTDRISLLLNEMDCIKSVDVATDFEQATPMINQYFFDIILVDMELPEKKGFALLQYIKATSPKTKTIIITNKSDDYYRAWGAKIGTDYFIDKSADCDKILQIITDFPHPENIVNTMKSYTNKQATQH